MSTARALRLPEAPYADATATASPFVADYVEHWAAVMPDSGSLTFMDYAESRKGVARVYTWAQIDRWSRAVATKIMSLGAAGERVAVLAPQGPEWIVGFLGALRTNLVGVPLFAPDMPGEGHRLHTVLDDCSPTVVLTTTAKLAMVQEVLAGRGGPAADRVVCVDDLEGDAGDALAAEYVRPVLDGDDLAYLQYTSGSTRVPAGVELTHANMVADALQLMDGHDLSFQTQTTVSWLPLFHDMGLMLGAGAPWVIGLHSLVMDPLAFVQRPLRWITALAEHGRPMSAAPNFAYDFCAKRIKEEDKAGLDLSGVWGLINGAEPVREDTIDAFQAAFGPNGLPPEAMRPAYGLAEAVVLVATSVPHKRPVLDRFDVDALQQGRLTTEVPEGGRTVSMVASGVGVGQQVIIVDPATNRELPEGHVGEVWTHGPNVGRGYFGRPEETEATFKATLVDPGERPAGPWLRTGDLAALVERDLYVTGRIKDVIIVDGRNIYPQDIEATVEEAHEAVALHRLAAFAVPGEAGEGLVVVAEQYKHAADAGERLPEIAAAVRQAVSEQHAVSLTDFVLIAPGTVPRTSSGKIARSATRTAYLEDALARVASGAAA